MPCHVLSFFICSFHHYVPSGLSEFKYISICNRLVILFYIIMIMLNFWQGVYFVSNFCKFFKHGAVWYHLGTANTFLIVAGV